MDDAHFNQIVESWIAYEAAENTPEREKHWWAELQVMDWAFGKKAAELLWRFILAVYPRELSDATFSVLAAGPVEDLLSRHGAAYIDRVEELARQDMKFNNLLGGVWRNNMTDDVWNRVQAVRKKAW